VSGSPRSGGHTETVHRAEKRVRNKAREVDVREVKEKRRDVVRRKKEASKATHLNAAPHAVSDAAVLKVERDKVRRLETAQLGDVALATAAGAAAVGGLFGLTGAILGVAIGAAGGVALRLATRHL
jgi:hypothetical protein